jgi:hypothetical protein
MTVTLHGFPLNYIIFSPIIKQNWFKKLTIFSLASVLPVFVMDQKRGQVITHGETNLSFLPDKATQVQFYVCMRSP